MNTMKILVLGAVAVLGLAPGLRAAGTNQLADEMSRVSYALGLNIGRNLQNQGLVLNPDLLSQAIKDVLASNTTLLTTEEMQKTLTDFQREFAAAQQERRAAAAVKNKADGEAFLAANKTKPGVQTLPDGLQYLVITNGSGPTPSASDTVAVNYLAATIGGTELDNTFKRGQPQQFPAGDGFGRGWSEAIQKMPIGARWKLFIPAELAFGEAGFRNVEPNTVLVIEVELLAAKPAAPPPAAAPPPLTSDIIRVPSAEEMKKGAKIEVIKPEDAAKLQKTGQ